MDWNDFARRLAAELVGLPVDAYVIVQRPGGFPYVQAMRHPNGLAGEAVSDTFLSERLRLDQPQTRRMITLGWHEPDGHGRVNWWHDLVIPANLDRATPDQLAECDRLAGRMAAALHEVYGVRSPDELEYRAGQNGRGGGPIPLPGLGLRAVDQVPLAAPPSDEPTPQMGPQSGQWMGWPEFTERLAAELAGMDDGMVIVVHRADQDAYYVQAHRDQQRIRGEAVGNELLEEPLRFPDADDKRLADAGWGAPGPNWWIELPPAPPPAEFRRLAAMMVTALRDVQKARDPADLRYEAFRGDIGIELADFGVELADPDSVSERRTARPLPADVSAAAEPAAVPAIVPAAVDPAAVDPAAVDPAAVDPAELQAGLVAAKQDGDQAAYLALVGDAGLIVPSTGTAQGVEFATTQLNDGTYVLTFTSSEAMRQVLRDQARHHRHVTMTRLAAEWPNPAWRLSIDLGLPSEAYFDANVVADLAAPAPEQPTPEPVQPTPETQTPETQAAETQAAPAEVARPAPGLDAPADASLPPAIMQKVVPHPLVVHYLDGSYDRVAGYVHRASDVADLTTPERLVHGLGLTYENSPFSPDDAAIHVIRWAAHKPELFKTPLGGVDEASMRSVPDGWVIERPPFLGTGFAPGDGPPIPEFKIASQRLPHGAEMYRVAHTGEVTRVAVFDADLGRWLPTSED